MYAQGNRGGGGSSYAPARNFTICRSPPPRKLRQRTFDSSMPIPPGGLRGVLGLVPSPGTQRRDGGAESGCEADSDKQDEIGQFGLS